MTDVLIYTKSTCPYCHAAKDLLNSKKIAYKEVSVDGKPHEQDAMAMKANGRRSVPQIFINGQHIGGCDDIHALDAKGHLDKMLVA